ncbi:hypothetical protein LOC67_06985 [Stieleria sp. JC731]|uniref:hypothetical protein n=1 Tax=Pirellulaceae TaxID=2691357 RepID=UPI001E3D295B|nr:hypothetical protein [Stieleria sp. JC731]MCC9600301.1 hypothetical protein [Stieleria sp. JC731]
MPTFKRFISRSNCSVIIPILALVLLVGRPIQSLAEEIALINADEPMGGWTFDNGKEFPGAVGRLELINEDQQPTLKLHGDFSGGGNYVQAAKSLPNISIDSVDFEIKVPSGVSKVTTRLIDGTGQCHQLDIRLSDKGGWQNYSFPVARYFAGIKAGTPMDIVTRYEKWGGANDGAWHQPLKLLVFLAGKEALRDGSISLRNVRITPTPPKTEIEAVVRLDDFNEGSTGSWGYNNGDEFKGARGGLVTLSAAQAESGDTPGLKLSADFSAGGRYVGARRSVGTDGVRQTKMVRFKVRTSDVEQVSVRLVDETGQCHQRGGIELNADGRWHTIELDPLQISGGEHWAGANDGKWHGALSFVELMLSERSSSQKSMSLELADLHVENIVEADVANAAWSESFDSADTLKAWDTSGDVTSHSTDGNGSLRLHRSLDGIRNGTSAAGPSFPVRRGHWQVAFRDRGDLYSPDDSYHARVMLVALDSDGAVIEQIPIATRNGSSSWQDVAMTVSLPASAKAARVHVDFQKTYGDYSVDDLAIRRLEVQPPEPIVRDIRIASETTGNLFLPEDRVQFQLTVNTSKSLAKSDRVARCVVKDYRGDVVLGDLNAVLVPSEPNSPLKYVANLDVPVGQLNVGQFYELHVAVPQSYGAEATELSGFARLPIAPSKQFKPEQIPFTIRNWDSRIREYFYLADRLGLRQIGIWGSWQNDPPYKPHAPGIEICKELNAKWITGTPASDVERNGFENVTEESLRQGMTNFLKAYADKGLLMIAQGNEPHGTGQVVLDNVRAYRANYEAVKAFDPAIEVVGTSVEPNEEYFKAGYQKYLDSYDFHIYEHYTAVRRTMQQYRELMEKYDAVKPIHSTELGLNSAGQSRLSVAIELIKKCTVFFAEGGKTVSWFTIQYPDTDGTSRGQFGNSHCVFDCKFNNYNPRLDALTHYHMINAMLDKRFVEEEQRKDGTQVYLFRNSAGESLLVVWNDIAEAEVALSVSDAESVRQIRIDGQTTELSPADGTLSVTVNNVPQLILF